MAHASAGAVGTKMARLWNLFVERTPDFSGEVAVIGHSLGSVIMFDILQKGVGAFSQGLLVETDTECRDSSRPGVKMPMPRCFFAVGSPLGMFLSIRRARCVRSAAELFRGLDVRWPVASVGQGWRFFNVFHPGDPIAYRIEPLLNVEYASMAPRNVPRVGGWDMWGGLRGLLGKNARETDEVAAHVLLVPAAKPEVSQDFLTTSQGTVAVDRIDYALQESGWDSVHEFIAAFNSHFAYWENEDLVNFIVDQISESLWRPPKAPDSDIASKHCEGS